ncbi:MAG: hypothetical protein U0441_14215 [Polyangiaceae bacterium]
MSAAVLNRLLRTPADIAADCRDDRDMRSIASTSLGALALGAAVFGGVIGSYRGGIQIFYGAVKVPLAMMATLAFCVPAFHAIAAGLGRAFPIRTIVGLVLAAAGRAALVLFALAPLLWLAFDRGLDYHRAVMLSSLAYAGAGGAALSVLVHGLGKGPHRALTAIAFAAVFFAVGGQASWILRPYLIRPRTWEAAEHHAQRIPFVRGYEGTFADSLFESSRSAYIYNGREVRDDDPRLNVDEQALPTKEEGSR